MNKLVGWLLGAALLWILWPAGFVEGAPLTQGAAWGQHGASQGGHPGPRGPSQPAGSSWAEVINPQEVPKPRRNPRSSPRRRKLGPGRPGPNSQYVTEEKVVFELKVCRQEEAIQEEALLDGFFLMVSNRDSQEWPASRLLGLYKRQYKVEQVFHVLKGPLAVAPMLLEKPNRICAMIFILTLALQLYTLIQRQAAQELLRRNYPLEGLMPNKIRTWRPQTQTLLAAFDNINWVEILHEGFPPLRSVTSLNPLHAEILGLLGVPVEDYSVKALTPKSGEP